MVGQSDYTITRKAPKGTVERSDMVNPLTLSRSGSFFRTVAFMHADASKNFTVRQEAVEHPTTNKWRIMEVWTRPNTVTADPPVVEDYSEVKDPNYDRPLTLDMAEAIAHLATFEASNKTMGLESVGSTVDELGDEHVSAFAGLNGYAIDITGKAHTTLFGRIVTKGYFAPETRTKVMDLYNRPVAERPPVNKNDLSRIFNSSTIVENFDRLIERKVDLSRWNKFVKTMGELVGNLCTVQNDKFGEAEVSTALGMMKKSVIRYEKDYQTAVEASKSALRTLTFIPEEDKKAKYERMFQEIHLVYEVAHAKALYARMNSSNDPEKHKNELQEQVKKAAKFCLAMGGSERDVQLLNAEIIENGPVFSVEGVAKTQAALHKAFQNHDITTHSSVYFLPPQIGDILNSLTATTKELENIVAAEKTRIQAPVGSEVAAVEAAVEAGKKKDHSNKPKPPNEW